MSSFCNCLFVFLIACSLPGCKSVSSSSNDALTIATKKLGHDLETYPNSTNEFVLYLQSTKTNLSAIRFLVVRIKDGQILVEDHFIPGYIKWDSESTLEVLSVPGILKEGENLSDYKKIIDIRTLKK